MKSMMNSKPKNNEKGFTLIEMLVAMAISVILLGAAMYTYTKQDSLLRDENKNLKLRDFARFAMTELDENLRMAGFGFPPGDSDAGRVAQGVVQAQDTTITFMANIDNITTFASSDNDDPTSNAVQVLDVSSFSVDDNVVFFNVEDPDDGRFGPLTSVIPGPKLIGFGSQNGFTFEPIDDGVAVVVNKYHTLTYTYNAGSKIITLTDDNGTDDGGGDDTTVTVASQVSSLTFSYFDADGNALGTPMNGGNPDLGEIRRVQIMIIIVDDDDPSVTATLMTDVTMRNMGI
jgi:type IV pilus assembly protein PilW